MSPHDGDARVLEQFLRTMAPPAGLTAVYRQRVVRASLDARSQAIMRHQRRVVLWGCLIVCGCVMLPTLLVSLSLQALSPDLPWASLLPEPADLSRWKSVDSFELATMESQAQSRWQMLLASSRSTGP